MTKHRCCAVSCAKIVRDEYLMCRAHWYMVPQPIRARVFAAYRPEQLRTAEPSLEWYLAAADAVEAVARAESRDAGRNHFRLMAERLASEATAEGGGE